MCLDSCYWTIWMDNKQWSATPWSASHEPLKWVLRGKTARMFSITCTWSDKSITSRDMQLFSGACGSLILQAQHKQVPSLIFSHARAIGDPGATSMLLCLDIAPKSQAGYPKQSEKLSAWVSWISEFVMCFRNTVLFVLSLNLIMKYVSIWE